MKFSEMSLLAEGCLSVLAPSCERIAIAGSIRRRCPECRDIELVCIPRARDLFGFAAAVNQWVRIKGEPTGRYTQRRLPSGVKLDLFMATPGNWGLILAIRTGSARFSHEVLARGWCDAGYVSRGGMLRPRAESCSVAEDGAAVPVREEADLFRLIGVPWIAPEDRS